MQAIPPDIVIDNVTWERVFGLLHRESAPGAHIMGTTKDAGGDYLIIRIPRKAEPAADSEFLRRLLLDVAGRQPTPLELHYFLRDTDSDKHRKVVEKVVEQQDPHHSRIKIVDAPRKVPDRAARAEEYIKEKLGKKQLSAEERQLLLRALEFAEKERPQVAPAAPQAINRRQ